MRSEVSTLDEKDKEYIKSKLELILKENLSDFHSLTPDLEIPTKNTTSNFPVRFKNRKKMIVDQIKKTITLLERDQFQICNECGKMIDTEKLRQFPLERICQNCLQSNED